MRFCPHFNQYLQSGYNKTLKEINRHYTTEDYKQICKKLRETRKYLTITTDVIVGFPGESDDNFASTCDYVKKIKLNLSSYDNMND